MTRAYSLDLRERVIQYIENGHDKQSAATLFSVGIATVYRWLKRKSDTGSLKASKRARAYQRIDNEQLKKYIEENPDAFLSEIAEKFSVTEQAIFYALKRLKITRKKRQLFTKKGIIPNEKSSSKS